jgi:hypothetical protein
LTFARVGCLIGLFVCVADEFERQEILLQFENEDRKLGIKKRRKEDDIFEIEHEEETVPEGWLRKFSDKKNRHYYVNLKTKQSQWTNPLGDRAIVKVIQKKRRHVKTIDVM